MSLHNIVSNGPGEFALYRSTSRTKQSFCQYIKCTTGSLIPTHCLDIEGKNIFRLQLARGSWFQSLIWFTIKTTSNCWHSMRRIHLTNVHDKTVHYLNTGSIQIPYSFDSKYGSRTKTVNTEGRLRGPMPYLG